MVYPPLLIRKMIGFRRYRIMVDTSCSSTTALAAGIDRHTGETHTDRQTTQTDKAHNRDRHTETDTDTERHRQTYRRTDGQTDPESKTYLDCTEQCKSKSCNKMCNLSQPEVQSSTHSSRGGPSCMERGQTTDSTGVTSEGCIVPHSSACSSVAVSKSLQLWVGTALVTIVSLGEAREYMFISIAVCQMDVCYSQAITQTSKACL